MSFKFSIDSVEFVPRTRVCTLPHNANGGGRPRQTIPITPDAVGANWNFRQYPPWNLSAPEFIPTYNYSDAMIAHQPNTYPAHLIINGGRNSIYDRNPVENDCRSKSVNRSRPNKPQARRIQRINHNKKDGHDKLEKHEEKATVDQPGVFPSKGYSDFKSGRSGSNAKVMKKPEVKENVDRRQPSRRKGANAIKPTQTDQALKKSECERDRWHEVQIHDDKKYHPVKTDTFSKREGGGQVKLKADSLVVDTWSEIVQRKPQKKNIDTSPSMCAWDKVGKRKPGHERRVESANAYKGGSTRPAGFHGSSDRVVKMPGSTSMENSRENTKVNNMERMNFSAEGWRGKHGTRYKDANGREKQTHHRYLEWRQVSSNAKRANEGFRYRNAVERWKDDQQSWRKTEMITENYRYNNVSKEFSERVKRKLLASHGCDFRWKSDCRGCSRGWYDQGNLGLIWGVKYKNCLAKQGKVIEKDIKKDSSSIGTKMRFKKEVNVQLCGLCGRRQASQSSAINEKQEVIKSETCICGERKMRRLIEEVENAKHDRTQDQTVFSNSRSKISDRSHFHSRVDHRHEDYEKSMDDHGLNYHNDDDDDDDGWITVEEKPKRKLKERRIAKERANQNQFGPEVNGNGALQRKREGNKVLDDSSFKNWKKAVIDSKKEDECNKQKQDRMGEEKKAKKRRKKRRKETPMYENDQKKIREFKMLQMINENVKLDLVELAGTRVNQNATVRQEAAAAVEEWPAIGNANVSNANILSFSAALKRKAQPKSRAVVASKRPGILEISKLTVEEKAELRRQNWKMKRKLKKKERKQRKKADEGSLEVEIDEDLLVNKPITLDLGIMLDKILNPEPTDEPEEICQSRTAKHVVFSSGVISVASGLAKKNKPDGTKAESSRRRCFGNALDSTQPMKLSGKERERPKNKTPTVLKRAILRAREAKRQIRESKEIAESAENMDAIRDLTETVENGQQGMDHGSNSMSLKSERNENAWSSKSKEAKEKEKTNDSGHLINHKTLTDTPEEVAAKLHTRKFREYCDHFLSKDIDKIVFKILKDLQRFQTRAFIENPIKAKAKKRLVLGIREVGRHLKMTRLKCVIIAPNLERVSNEGGIDSYLSKIIFDCKQFSIPIIYSMNRQALGMALGRKVPVSAIGIFNYAGVEDDYKELCSLVKEQREKYKGKVEQLRTQESQPPMEPQAEYAKQGSSNEHKTTRNVFKAQAFTWNLDVSPFVPQAVMYNYYTSKVLDQGTL